MSNCQIVGTFDVVVVNLYPFYKTVTAGGSIEFEDGIENIDIGGPAMIRAAAKVSIKIWFYCSKTALIIVPSLTFFSSPNCPAISYA